MPSIPLIIEHMNPLPPFEEKLGQCPAPHVEPVVILPSNPEVLDDNVTVTTKPKKKRVRKINVNEKPTVEKKRSRPSSSAGSTSTSTNSRRTTKRSDLTKSEKKEIEKLEKMISDIKLKKRVPLKKTQVKEKSTEAAAPVKRKKPATESSTVARGKKVSSSAATKQKEKELLYKVNDLRNLCREKKISNFSRMNKGQMIEVLAL